LPGAGYAGTAAEAAGGTEKKEGGSKQEEEAIALPPTTGCLTAPGLSFQTEGSFLGRHQKDYPWKKSLFQK
jgi:hypothetical protein